MPNNKNTMTRDAFLFLPAKVVEGLLIMLCGAQYTRFFLEPAVAAFNLTNTTVQLTYLILAGWMANASTRYVGEEYQKDRGQALFSTVSTIYLLICAGVTVVCVAAAAITGNTIYLGGALLFFSYTIFQILNSALIQLGRIRASIFLSLTSAALKLALAYAFIGGRFAHPSPFPAIFANTIADGVAGLGAVLVLSIPTLARLRFFSKPLLSQFLKYGVPLLGVSVSVALLNQIDKYMVQGFFGAYNYAYYSANNAAAAGIFTMISVGIMRGVYPAVLRGWREGGREVAKPLLDSGVRLYMLIAMPAVAGLTAVSLPLSEFLYKEGYSVGAPVIGLTALAMFFMGLTEYANKAYELEQSTLPVLQNSAAAAVIKVVSSLVFFRFFGFIGGAVGSVAAFSSYFIITAVRVRKRFLFHVPPASIFKILLSSLLCGSAALAVIILPAASLGMEARLILGILAGIVVYTAGIVLSGEGREEFRLICRKVRKK